MAKKKTWEKRAKKVKKEEFIVLGGKTGKKSSGPSANKDSNKDEKEERKPRKRTGSSSDNSDSKPKFKGRKEKPKFGFGAKLPSEDKPERAEREPFRNRGNADKQFRSGDKKKSYGKFTNDDRFKGFQKDKKKSAPSKSSDLIRLNKYLSMAGICSRREADKFIEQGLVSINGKPVTELGTKVKPNDVVEYAGEKVKAEALRYVLLNKPKDCITTLSDERGRSTVIGLVKNACKERIYPVGRLDRNTTGLILLTNDGDLADKLAHPSNEVRKVYHVITDKNVSISDLKKLETGVQLDDGVAKADAALFAGDGSVRNEIGLEIHSGKNRVVRRMFEALGYDVSRLDRAAFAGLSKKGLPRGRWRYLTDKEVGYLKML